MRLSATQLQSILKVARQNVSYGSLALASMQKMLTSEWRVKPEVVKYNA